MFVLVFQFFFVEIAIQLAFVRMARLSMPGIPIVRQLFDVTQACLRQNELLRQSIAAPFVG